jgi:putative hydrolase of the HAD superfamily
MTPEVGAVFFDSGGTLTFPTAEGWWPKPRFEELVAAAGLPAPEEDAARRTLAEGSAHLAQHLLLADLEQELDVYVGFYRIVLRRLFGSAPDDLVDSLAAAAVYDLDQEAYPDVVPTLDRLHAAGIATGVVSNAGPSLELRYRDMGLRDRFDPFVLSAMVGMEKPAPGIYLHALDETGRAAAEVAFVDDVPANVEASTRLGMRSFLIDRDGGAATGPDLVTVPDLEEMLTALGIGDLDPQVDEPRRRRA